MRSFPSHRFLFNSVSIQRSQKIRLLYLLDQLLPNLFEGAIDENFFGDRAIWLIKQWRNLLGIIARKAKRSQFLDIKGFSDGISSLG
jgi:hypothetical protein